MDEDKLDIQYHFTENEAVTAAKEISKSVSSHVLLILPLAGYTLLISAVLIYIVKGEILIDLLLFFIVGIMLSAFPFLVTFEVKRNFRKNPSANTIIQYLINKEGVEIRGEGFEGKFSWEKILKVEKRKRGFLIFTQPRIANWIPVSSFNNEQVLILEKLMTAKGVIYKKLS